MQHANYEALYAALFKVAINMWPLTIILIFFFLFKTNWFKGVFGEFIVNSLLRVLLSKQNYHLIPNVTLAINKGTTQIDHIVLSENGIFVIETKNFNGWIYGSTQQSLWTQKIYRHTSKFQNPLHQNFKHIIALSKLLDIDHNSIFNVVVFVGNNHFKTLMPPNITTPLSLIKFIRSKSKPLFRPSEIKDFIQLIEHNMLKRGIQTDLKHIKHLRKKRSRSSH